MGDWGQVEARLLSLEQFKVKEDHNIWRHDIIDVQTVDDTPMLGKLHNKHFFLSIMLNDSTFSNFAHSKVNGVVFLPYLPSSKPQPQLLQ